MNERLTVQRIGIYGGTFDPIHSGHVEVAGAILKNFGLDLMLVVPAACPPHKKKTTVSDSYHRYALAVLATLDTPGILVSTIELEQPDRPYTYQTLERLRARYAGASLFLVIGSDSFEDLHLWKEPLRILSEANLIVAARPGYEMRNNRLLRMLSEAKAAPKTDETAAAANVVVADMRGRTECETNSSAFTETGGIFLTDYTWRDVSSTEVRERARLGRPIIQMVPRSVADYIHKYEIYRN